MLRISTTLCILFTAALAHSAVIVEQIEAPELGNFSPVSNPFGIATDPTFPGKTFIALDSASAGQSEHADAVAQDFYGPSSVAATAVSKVYADDANHFISTQLLTQKSTGSAPAPQPLPPGLSVANLSFVATLGSRLIRPRRNPPPRHPGGNEKHHRRRRRGFPKNRRLRRR